MSRQNLASCAMALALAACGGGGGGSDVPNAEGPEDLGTNEPSGSDDLNASAPDRHADDEPDLGVPRGSGGSAGADGVGSTRTETPPTTPPNAEPPPSLEDLAEAPAAVVPWTIVVYGHADHSLSNSLLVDMREMAAAELGSAVQLVVLADWDSSQLNRGLEPPVPFPDGLQLFMVQGGGAPPRLIAQGAEVNLDDPVELAVTVRDVFAALPAQRRGLVLWDHGGGWFGGYGGDTQNGTAPGAPMGAELVADAVRVGLDAAGITQDYPLDFIAFDTCLMAGVEVAFPFRELTHTYLADAEIDFGAGWDYTSTLTHFAQNALAPMSQLAVAEVAHWDAHHAKTTSDRLLRSHAALDLSQLDAFAAASASLTATMLESSTFDPLELGRSAFFALSPYSSTVEGVKGQPALRDIGQVLSALGGVQSDPQVAAAAQTARQALDSMVLATSQGLLRGGLQAGVHVEQSLGSNVTPDRLAAYRSVASQWVAASRWDKLLEFASSAADSEPPAFTHAVLNAEGADRSTPPILQLVTDDATAAKGAVYAALQTASNTTITLGLVGSGTIDPGVVTNFQWDARVVGFADGQIGMLDVWLDSAPGAQALLSIEGRLTGVFAQPLTAYLIFGGSDLVAATVVVLDGARPIAFSTSDLARSFPGLSFTPVHYELGAGPAPLPIFGNPMLITAQGFQLFDVYLRPGAYSLHTSVTDLWGNTATESDPLQLLEPLGP